MLVSSHICERAGPFVTVPSSRHPCAFPRLSFFHLLYRISFSASMSSDKGSKLCLSKAVFHSHLKEHPVWTESRLAGASSSVVRRSFHCLLASVLSLGCQAVSLSVFLKARRCSVLFCSLGVFKILSLSFSSGFSVVCPEGMFACLFLCSKSLLLAFAEPFDCVSLFLKAIWQKSGQYFSKFSSDPFSLFSFWDSFSNYIRDLCFHALSRILDVFFSPTCYNFYILY